MWSSKIDEIPQENKFLKDKNSGRKNFTEEDG